MDSSGLRVVELIEAATSSMRGKGETVYMQHQWKSIVIPFVDLKAQYASIKDEVNAAIQGVLDSCQFTLGSEVAAFERSSPRTARAKHGIGVNTGTSALHLALLAAGVGPGDEVITVPFTFVATVSAIDYTGANTGLRRHRSAHVHDGCRRRSKRRSRRGRRRSCRFTCTVSRPTWTRSSKSRGGAASSSSKTRVRRMAPNTRDAAPAAWATWAASASIPARISGAYGEGGMVVTTQSRDYARTIRMLRDWGAEKKYHHVLKGYNYRMEGIQGAVLRVKLRHLEAWTEARRAAAARYDRLLAGQRRFYARGNVVRAARLSRLCDSDRPSARSGRTRCNAQGIQTGIHYPIPVHLLPAFADLGYRAGQFPHSERAANEVLSLPMFAELTEAQSIEVSRAITELAANQGATKSAAGVY